MNWNFNFFFKNLGLLHRFTLFSNHNVAKSSCGLCFWAPDPLIGPGAQTKSKLTFMKRCILMKMFTKDCFDMANSKLAFIFFFLLNNNINKQKKLFVLKIVFQFWSLQLTFDIFNWVYSKHMIHYNKVNWKNFAKNFLKIFPIEFQSSIDFKQLHMIQLLDTIYVA